MGRDPAIIKVKLVSRNIVDTRYVRDDGTVWRNRCEVGDNEVSWAAYQDNTLGRWRSEDVVTYTITGSQIRVVGYSYGEQVLDQTYSIR